LTALDAMPADPPEAIVLALDESGPLDALRTARTAAPEAAIVVVTDADHAADGTIALHAGAEDHLIRDATLATLLPRAVRYAVGMQRVRRELDSGETVERQIPQIYALLSLALERGPLQIAWAAMKGDDRALRGTALEYLANVLPEDVFKRLRSLFGAFTWTAEPVPRPVSELANELRTSAMGLKIERPPWRETGETGETS